MSRRFRGVPGDRRGLPAPGARTIYGATKLCGELLIEEYAAAYGLRAVINRCGVIAGPWQMGKVDQGVFTYWMLAHHFNRPLDYIGFGGSGKQVRDLLHVDDLVDLVAVQLENLTAGRASRPTSAGAARAASRCSRHRPVPGDHGQDSTSIPHGDAPGDIPIYIRIAQSGRLTDWRPNEARPRSLRISRLDRGARDRARSRALGTSTRMPSPSSQDPAA